jgi:hypothetical protein
MVFSRWRRVWWARCFFKIGGFDWPRFSMITTRLGLGTDACLYLGVLSDLYCILPRRPWSFVYLCFHLSSTSWLVCQSVLWFIYLCGLLFLLSDA